jgi:TadE-like protein
MHSFRDRKMHKFTSLLSGTQGAAILEFAISVPILVVFVVGIYDFSSAFNQKQKIAQAAQEGAILAASQPMSDIASVAGSNPPSLQGVTTAIYNSLLGDGVLPSGGCPAPGAPTLSGLTWTYTIACNVAGTTDNLVVTINRGWVSTATTPATVGTVVTVQYTYYWQFNRVIQLLFPSGTGYAPTTLLTEASTVHNQT